MRGLDPRIHLKKESRFKMMDCRVKPGNDVADRSGSTMAGIKRHCAYRPDGRPWWMKQRTAGWISRFSGTNKISNLASSFWLASNGGLGSYSINSWGRLKICKTTPCKGAVAGMMLGAMARKHLTRRANQRHCSSIARPAR
jgi:hypothetical protein